MKTRVALWDGDKYIFVKEECVSINDPITVEYNEKRKKYYLQRGRETFYDEKDRWRMWNTPEEALEWARKEGLIDGKGTRS